MGNIHIEKCPITGLNTENYPSTYDLAEYTIDVNGKRLMFRFPWNHQNSTFVELNKHILHGLILNGRFPSEFNSREGPVLNNEKLEKIIREAVIPKTPEEKINHLLNFLHSLQDYEGSEVKFPKGESRQNLAIRLFFKNYQELVFYLFTLLHQGYITGIDSSSKHGADLIGIKLTYQGLSRVIELSESGLQSERCFVAMSFSKAQSETRKAIKSAVLATGHIPILIDEQHIDSDVTINDALIAEIRKSKFVVADFSEHKHGVYFEAGFALGINRPVIYLCEKSEFNKTHFDTNHYPHIIYENSADLEEQLRTKIEAWIT